MRKRQMESEERREGDEKQKRERAVQAKVECVCFGGSGSDSRQRGSAMAGHWIRLQPELPQYAQYNVPLCSPLPDRLTSAAGALPACRTTITTKNTPTKLTRRATEVYTRAAQAGKKCTDTPRKTRTGKYESRQGRKTDCCGAETLSLPSFFFLFPPHQSFLP